MVTVFKRRFIKEWQWKVNQQMQGKARKRQTKIDSKVYELNEWNLSELTENFSLFFF